MMLPTQRQWTRELLMDYFDPNCWFPGSDNESNFGNRCSPGSKPPRLPDLNFSMIERALTGAEHRDWLMFCYKPTAAYADDVTFFSDVFATIPANDQEKLKPFILLAAYEARHQALTGKKRYSGKELAALKGCADQTWRKLWAPRWALLVAAYLALDEEGLNHVFKRTGRARRAA